MVLPSRRLSCLRSFAPLAFLLVAACEGHVTQGDDDGTADDDGGDAGEGPDAEMPCVPTGIEIAGDHVDNDCDGIIDELLVCADGSAQFTTLHEAIAAAPDGSGVEVCAGTYAETLAISDKSIRINGAGADTTILDAGGGTGLTVTDGHKVTIAGFTIRGGAGGSGGGIRCVGSEVHVLDGALVDNRASAGGGGLYAEQCQIEVTGTRFTGNEGAARGGAAFLVGSTGAIAESQFSGNAADEGGALYLIDGAVDVRASRLTGNHARGRGGAIYQMSDSAVEDTVLSGNDADWTGGAVYVWQHAPTFRRNTIDHNDAAWEGGAMYLHQSSVVLEDNGITDNTSFDDGGALRIFECHARLERNLIARNKAVDGDGGAFKSSHLAGTYIDNQIIDNEALGAGGGIELDNDASVVRGGVISGNKASIGGGIHAMLWPWNGGLIEGVQISGNHAWRGGAMYLENNFQAVTIRRVVIQGNSAHQGAGIYTRGTPLRLSNSLITGNVASDVGGGFYVDPSASYPWTHECPCPPIDPAASVDFVVVHANTADAGAAVWIAAPNLSFQSSIFTGHTTTAVVVAPGGTPTWQYNNTYPATFEGMGDPTGSSGNMATDPAFVAAASGDFHLQSTSACIDAGDPAFTDPDGSRADMGEYAGPYAVQ